MRRRRFLVGSTSAAGLASLVACGGSGPAVEEATRSEATAIEQGRWPRPTPSPSPSPTPAPGPVYTTSFDQTENPLSEGGTWQHADGTLTVCKTVGGVAFGTQAGGAYDDSNAYLAGLGNDHEVEGVVWLDPELTASANAEVEILLRWTDTNPLRRTPFGPTRAVGYELNWTHTGAYLILSRFKGGELVRAAAPPRPTTGDRFRARVEGQRIRAWVNDVIVLDYTDDEPLSRITSGHPGIGFYVDAGVPNTAFGFDAVTLRTL